MTGAEEKALLAYLNSSTFGAVASQSSESRSGGLQKHSVTTVRRFPVIDPSRMSENTVQSLADAFHTLRETARNGDSRDQILDTIDTLVHRAIEETRSQ